MKSDGRGVDLLVWSLDASKPPSVTAVFAGHHRPSGELNWSSPAASIAAEDLVVASRPVKACALEPTCHRSLPAWSSAVKRLPCASLLNHTSGWAGQDFGRGDDADACYVASTER